MPEITNRKEDDYTPRKCDKTERVYLVRDPGGYDWNPRNVGLFSTLELAQRAASHDQDTVIESDVVDCDCFHDDHRWHNEPKRPDDVIFIGGKWEQREPRKGDHAENH